MNKNIHQKKSRFLRSEAGETQTGVVIIALILGVACSIFYFVGDFLTDHKDTKERLNRERVERQDRPAPSYNRKGYQVRM